jgi:hypothetical protein
MNKIFFKILISVAFLIPAISNSKTIECPSQNFSKFLTAYQDDIRLQKIFIKKPLHWRYLEFGSSNLKSTMLKNDDDIPYPLVLPVEKWQELYGQDFKIKITKINNNYYGLLAQTTAEVRTDNYKMKFHFKFHKQCWRLQQVDNLLND